MQKNICVNGSRGFTDSGLMDYSLNILIPIDIRKSCRLILGGARGADTLAKEWAIKNSVEYLEIKAEWNKHGKSAGAIRNMYMIDISDALISFWDGKSSGTKHAIDYAKAKDMTDITIFRFDKIKK